MKHAMNVRFSTQPVDQYVRSMTGESQKAAVQRKAQWRCVSGVRWSVELCIDRLT
jgi:hypothetical protein